MGCSLAIVIRWPDGRVMAFNSDGSQPSECQGCFRDVKKRILAAATPATQFFNADEIYHLTPVNKEEWSMGL
jgi:hypothetical protein